MYVLQFYLNLFSVVLAQLRLTLHCRCIDASTSTPRHLSTFTSSHAHIRRSTSPPRTPTHLHIYITSVHPHCRSFTSVLSFFLHIFSLVSVHLHLRTLTSTDPPLHLHTSTDLYRTCTSHCHSLSTLSFSLSIHLFDNDNAGQLHVSLSGQPSSIVYICKCFFKHPVQKRKSKRRTRTFCMMVSFRFHGSHSKVNRLEWYPKTATDPSRDTM